MANLDQVIRLQSGVKGWNDWRAQTTERIDLQHADFRNEDLSGANLSDANLQKTVFSHAKLLGTDFSGALLHDASFDGAHLGSAKFNHTRLINCDFRGAKLRNADFSCAALDFANYHLANLELANFAQAELAFTIFAQTDLKQVKGLESCLHVRASSIDIETLRRSGPLPQKFLRGFGLKGGRIIDILSQSETPPDCYSAFISYSHADKAFARKLYRTLQDRGVACFLDEHQLLPGDDLHEGIDQGIRQWDKVLLCASKQSLKSWWVDSEINRAFQKEAQIMKERERKVLVLIPLNLDGFLFSPNCQYSKKAEIISRVAADFAGWEHDKNLLNTETEKVIRALRVDAGGRKQPPPSKL